MKTLTFTDHDEWMNARRGRITGSRLKNLVSKRDPSKKKIGFYEVIAERLGIISDSDESALEWGHTHEIEAIERFSAMTGKTVDPSLVMWTRDDDPNIAVSPDGVVIGENAAVECKCLSSARHIEALLTNAVPDDYKEQVRQYFIVNDDLETVYLCFFDPRLKHKDFFFLTVSRGDVMADIEELLIYERDTLREIEEIVAKLMTF